MNPWPLVVLQITVSSADARPSFRDLRDQTKQNIERPAIPDLLGPVARIASYASTSTTQWEFGSSGPYISDYLA